MLKGHNVPFHNTNDTYIPFINKTVYNRSIIIELQPGNFNIYCYSKVIRKQASNQHLGNRSWRLLLIKSSERHLRYEVSNHMQSMSINI